MTTFDRTIETAVGACEALPLIGRIKTICLVRDLRGRVRLIVEPENVGPESRAICHEIEDAVAAALGAYFERPVLSTNEGRERGRLAHLILDKGEPLERSAFPRAEGPPDSGNPVLPVWKIVERRFSKLSWLQQGVPEPPWPLKPGTPPIVAFYSFKGGVGRTTALVSCAWQLARKGKRLVVLDFDLEAPGLGSLLEVASNRGILDVVVDSLATGKTSLADATGAARAFGADDGARVDVLPAGRLSVSYVEKLARLDFAAAEPWDSDEKSSAMGAFSELLLEIKRKLAPDFILIDARAGLKDLSGISLRGLSHVDVLFSRASEQSYDGLGLALEILGRGRRGPPGGLVIVHALAPREPTSGVGQEETEEFRDRVYALFENSLYGEEPPPTDDETAGHWPWPLAREQDLERFSKLASVERILFSEDYRRLLDRIEELCVPEGDGEEEDEKEEGR